VQQYSSLNGAPLAEAVEAKTPATATTSSTQAGRRNNRTERRYLSVKDAADYMGRTPKAVYALIYRRILPAYRLDCPASKWIGAKLTA